MFTKVVWYSSLCSVTKAFKRSSVTYFRNGLWSDTPNKSRPVWAWWHVLTLPPGTSMSPTYCKNLCWSFLTTSAKKKLVLIETQCHLLNQLSPCWNLPQNFLLLRITLSQWKYLQISNIVLVCVTLKFFFKYNFSLKFFFAKIIKILVEELSYLVLVKKLNVALAPQTLCDVYSVNVVCHFTQKSC